MNIFDHFKLGAEREDFETVVSKIGNGVVLKGTNLWVLIFAIFIASLGLNVNSTAVIIGAMLVSPLMGPIMGLGLGMAINDLALLKKALLNYVLAAGVALAASALYFLISPINEAHSEILARVTPNVYDVLIALFGGLAGILAVSSKVKGNVIPGVAIATALMPPLCTAGYGLATLQFNFFFGAFYLFLINTVFIASATFIVIRVLKFPFKHLPDPKADLRSRRIVWATVIVTLLPSIYFAYDLNEQNKFRQRVDRFIEKEAVFPNNFLLKKVIDAKKRTIQLTYGGQIIAEGAIIALKQKMPQYDLSTTPLEIRQGFAYLQEKRDNSENEKLSIAILERETKVQLLQKQLDSIDAYKQMTKQIFAELKTIYPSIESYFAQPIVDETDTAKKTTLLAVIKSKGVLGRVDKKKIEQWIRVRTNDMNMQLYFEK